MQNYELLFILPGTLSEDEVPALIDKVKETLVENGAENLSAKDMGKSRLAYPIKHIRYGYFHLAHFEAEGNSVEVIKAKLKLIPELLRNLITIYDPIKGMSDKINFGHIGATSRGDEPRNKEREVDNVAANVRTSTPKVKEEMEEKKEEVIEKKETKTTSKKDSEKVALDDIDKKLDEILDLELDKV